MSMLYVENVPEDLYEALRSRAQANRKSISAEVLNLLAENVRTAAPSGERKPATHYGTARERIRHTISGSLAGSIGVMNVSLAVLMVIASASFGQTQPQKPVAQSESQATIDTGQALFLQNCAFCHGRDASGGETGPDLTGSKLVAQDVAGGKIGEVIRNGRPAKGMPRFNLSEQDINALVAFIHHQRNEAEAHPGARRRVDVSDLQTGDAEAGKQYFNGAGRCSTCHSVTGDLAGIARKYQGLALERRMLYPEKAKAKVTVRQRVGGEKITGMLEYRDEFTIGLWDTNGWYRAWPADEVTYSLDFPAEAHVLLLAKYTDADIHNLMAYLQTLR